MLFLYLKYVTNAICPSFYFAEYGVLTQQYFDFFNTRKSEM